MVIELVSIHKWPFSAISASNCGFPCATYYRTSPRKPLFSLTLLENCSFLNWKPTVPTGSLMDGHELNHLDISAQPEVALPVFYRGQKIHQEGFRLDLLVENRVIVELKSVARLEDIHKKQLLTYLRLAKKPLGLLINFNEILLKDGITRIINSPD